MLDDNDRLYPPHSTNGHDDDVPTPVPTHGAPGGTPRTIGKVASPIRHESTSTLFHFWVPRNTLVENPTGAHRKRYWRATLAVLWQGRRGLPPQPSEQH